MQQKKWLHWIIEAWGSAGVVVAAWWIGSLFAEQIRTAHDSAPFLELVGEPGGGKSTMIEFLWSCFGRSNWEGFDPNKSTFAGRARTFASAANLPVVMIEADRDDGIRRFNWEALKTAYNSRPVYTRGMKTSDNKTDEQPFRGALMISQNTRVEASEAILQRIVGVELNRGCHGKDSAQIVRQMQEVHVEAVSGVLTQTILQEKSIMKEYVNRVRDYVQQFRDNGINIPRLTLNHAQVAYFIDVLRDVHGLSHKQHQNAVHYLQGLAKDRLGRVAADPPTLIEFWDLYEDINNQGNGKERLNHSNKAGEIAINLNHMITLVEELKLGRQLAHVRDLKRLLPASRRFQYLKQARVSSTIEMDDRGYGKTIRCWIFAAPQNTMKTVSF